MGKKTDFLFIVWLPKFKKFIPQKKKTVSFYPIWTYSINFCEKLWGLYHYTEKVEAGKQGEGRINDLPVQDKIEEKAWKEA